MIDNVSSIIPLKIKLLDNENKSKIHSDRNTDVDPGFM